MQGSSKSILKWLQLLFFLTSPWTKNSIIQQSSFKPEARRDPGWENGECMVTYRGTNHKAHPLNTLVPGLISVYSTHGLSISSRREKCGSKAQRDRATVSWQLPGWRGDPPSGGISYLLLKKILLYKCQNGNNYNEGRCHVLVRMWGNGNPRRLMAREQPAAAICKSSVAALSEFMLN